MNGNTLKVLMGGAAGLCLAGLGIWASALAADVPQPVLKITQTATNQFRVQITNGVSFANYEVFRRPWLADPVFPFVLHLIGSQGTTNFTVTAGTDPAGFFIAAIGSDFDGDGIANYQDAQPTNGAVGVLSISIQDPTNGAVLTE